MRGIGRTAAATAACALVAATLAACGSSDDTTKTSDATTQAATTEAAATTSPVFQSEAEQGRFQEQTGFTLLSGPATEAELQTRVDGYREVPTELLVTDEVSKPIDAGKDVAVLVCGVPVCSEIAAGMEEAAKELGWKITRVDLGVSPEDFANAYNRAVELQPDIVIGSGIAREYIDKQLTKLGELGIPTIQYAVSMEPGNGVTWTMQDDPQYLRDGLMMAEEIALDSKLAGEAVVFNVEQYTVLTPLAHAIQKYLPQLCGDCKVDYQTAAGTDVGKLGPKVTGYLQANPGTKTVVCTFGDLCAGVGQAIKASGIKDVRIYTHAGPVTNLNAVKAGLETSAMPLANNQTGWQVIDAAARVFAGDDLAPTRLSPVQTIVQANVGTPSPETGSVPGYREKYRALWDTGN